MAHIFHHRQAICWCDLSFAAAHAHWLDSGNHLGCLCAEPVQYGQENSGCHEQVVRACYGVTLNGDIPWLVMYTMRNRLSHGYDTVDLELVWKTVKGDLPVLNAKVQTVMNTEISRPKP